MSATVVGPIGRVIRPQFDPAPRAFETITDEQFETAFEVPLQATVAELQQAFRDGAKRIVIVVPTTGMSGGNHYAHTAAAAEAIRLLVKSAARQWGAAGITVNAIAVDPATVLDDPVVAGPVSIAPRALASADPHALIEFLCSEAAGDVTGQTFNVDGGQLM